MKQIVKTLKTALCASLFFNFFNSAEAQRVVEDSWQRLTVEFTAGNVQVGTTVLGGETFSTLAIGGYEQDKGHYGAPALPLFSRLVEVPLGAEFKVTVSDAEYDTLEALPYRLLPVQLPRRKSDTTEPKLYIDRALYARDAFFGQEEALVEAVGVARDRRLARLQFAPVRYNPVSGQAIVCRKATVTVAYAGGDQEASEELFNRYYSAAFNSGAKPLNALYSSLLTPHSLTPKAVRTAAPVRYLIVAHSMFRGQLDDFVAWKRQKGFVVDVAYTDDPAVGSDTTSIRNYIKGQYDDASLAKPAPTYVLLVGDVAQIPPFNYRAVVSSSQDSHVTDLYYMTWTSGDHIPDCHYGRFSAQNISQLLPQIQKTLMYEQYTFADPSFLDRAVMVAGVDRGNVGDNGYTYGDPALDYAVTNYVNGDHGWANVYYFKNNTSIIPSCTTNVTISSSASGNAATVRQYYNLGAGLINYTAHGGSTGWGTPNFGNNHVNVMTNNQKFGLMIGNCCLTNKFEESTCFGEALLRKGNYAGAVGYIGGSNSTYWGQDFYWAVGVRSSIGPSMSMAYNASHLGVYDRTFHTHNEAYSQWCTTQGSMVMQGDMAVESSSSGSSMKWYYWEIYHLMGDPSVMPYMTQADTMSVAVSTTLPYGTVTLAVSAVPNAYIALTDTTTGLLMAAAFANAAGQAQLTLPASMPVGGYLLAVSAQQYRTALIPVTVVQPAGAFPLVTAITSDPLNAGDTVALTLHIENTGQLMARDIVATVTCSSPLLTLSTNTVTLDSLAAGASVDVSGIVAYVLSTSPDNTSVDFATSTVWTGGTLASTSTLRRWIYAPVLNVTFTPAHVSVMPGETVTVAAKLRNSGHAATGVHSLSFTSPTSLLTALHTPFDTALAPASDTTVVLTLQADTALPMSISVPVSFNYGSFDRTLPVYVGESYIETFEGGSPVLTGRWNFPAAYPWVVIDSLASEGDYCLRSSPNLTHRQSSIISITVDIASADSVSFYYRVSSEENYDKLYFIIDNDTLLTRSGDVDWSYAVYPVAAGSHTLIFNYSKDYSENRGSDCAWIDYVVLPHLSHPATIEQHTFCSADTTVEVGGIVVDLSQAGSGRERVISPSGAVTLLEYDIYPSYSETTQQSVCDSLRWQGELYTESTYIGETLQTIHGCDSLYGIYLTVNYSSFDTLSVTTSDESYTWNDSTYTASGVYQQVYTGIQGCDSTVVLVLTLTGTEGIGDVDERLNVKVYPNPTAGLLHFSTTVGEVTVYDLTGREVMLQRNIDCLDLGDVPQGTYLVRLTMPDATVTRRVVKQ